jgi:hypothetical protein
MVTLCIPSSRSLYVPAEGILASDSGKAGRVDRTDDAIVIEGTTATGVAVGRSDPSDR